MAPLKPVRVDTTGVIQTPQVAKPALLTDSGSGHNSHPMAGFLRAHGLRHIRDRAHHPQTTGKIERCQRTVKEVVTLVVHTSPDQLRAAIGAFVDHYNRERYHEALGNVTPDDVYCGRREGILARRKELRIRTMIARRQHYRRATASNGNGATGTPAQRLQAQSEVYLGSTLDLCHEC